MKSMRLTEMNKMITAHHSQGTPHNTGIKAKSMIEAAGHEMKENPPKILAHTAKKFGKTRAKKQKIAIMLSKARQAGAHISKN